MIGIVIGITLLHSRTMDWNDGHMGDSGGRVLLLMLCLLLGVAVIALVVWLALRAGGPGRDGDRSRADARGILAGRLARGEIEPDEYHERLQHLQ